MTKPFDKVLDALNVERRNGTSAEAHCPAHEDNQASLSISEGKGGKVLLKCHAGCDTASVVEHAGLEWSDLFPDNESNGQKDKKREIVARYTYTDAERDVRFQVVRFKPKGFSQYTPGKGWGRKKYGIDTMLYRLPRVIETAQKGHTVFIVEGEKDVHTLEDWGLTATTCPQGVDEWEDRFSEHLRGAHVVLLPDNDDQGRRHMEAVARSVWDAAENVRIVELGDVPEKGDVTDWVRRGHTLDEFKELVNGTETLSEPPAPPESDREPDEQFWYMDEKRDRIAINRGRLLAFFEHNGFGKIYAEDELHSTKVRVQDQVARLTSAERMKDFAIGHVRQLDNDEVPGGYTAAAVQAALLRGANVYFSDALFEFLPVLELDFKRDTADTSYFYFQNCFVGVTEETFEAHSYSDLDGVIWADQIIDRNFESLLDSEPDPLEWDFGRFLWHIAGKDAARHRALMSAIGYLLHGHKDPACTKAVAFMDQQISDVPSGRSGKSLVGNAISKLVPTLRIDGKNFSFERRFAFQSVQLGTKMIEFNDAPRSFDFERLFSMITDDMQIRRKGRDEFTISFSDSPKFLISTNYVVEGQGPSFEDRIFELEFAPHYSKEHRPVDEFGRRFFDGWDEEEWTRFDNVMLACVQSYLRNGLQPYRHVNLKERKLRQETSPDFAEFALGLELKEYNKKALFQSFKDAYEPDYETLYQRTFTRWLKTYANLYDLTVSERQSGRDYFISIQE